ncbi:unnamed protein product [Diamesa tonsa]
MYISCSICNVVKSNSQISATRCGHIFHNQCLAQRLKHKNVCPQCRFECSTRKLVKLYMNCDSIATSSSSNASSSSCNVEQKPENSDEKAVKLQTTLNDTVETMNVLALTVCNLDDKIVNLERKIEVLHGELMLMKKDLPLKRAYQINHSYNQNDVLGSTLARVLKTVEDSSIPSSSVLIGRQSINFLMNQHILKKKKCSCQRCYQKI